MPIYLVDYDESWPRLFSEESRRIRDALGSSVRVEHIGSTAIPGMIAKPIIDIMVLIDDIEAAPNLFEPLRALSYHYFPYAEDVTPERRWFCKPNPRERTHHLHLVECGSAFHRDRLLFRDYLIEKPREAARYASLKRELARRHPTDREAYTEGKAGFVAAVQARAGRPTRGCS